MDLLLKLIPFFFKLPLKPGNCLAGNVCNNNGSGPICGICSESGVMTAQGCKSCPPEEIIGPLRNMALVLALLAFFIFWLLYSWSPLFPSIAQYTGRCFGYCFKSKTAAGGAGYILVMMYTIVSKVKDLQDFANNAKLAQYFKIFVGYFQVTSSFLSFQVQWPATLMSAMMWLKATINFSVLSLPGISCLWRTIKYRRKLLVYTTAPLVFIALLAVPSCIALFRIWCSSSDQMDQGRLQSRQRRLSATLDRFWNAVMFTVFMMYPLVCLITLEPFDCQPYGLGLLGSDLREPCPDMISFERVWASLFIVMYPVGIPLASIIVLRSMGVHRLAQEKIDAAVITAMINLFIKRTTSVESHRIAQILGPIGSNQEDFRKRVRELYRFLWHSSTADCDESKAKQFGTQKLKIQINHAKGLPKMDRYGSIDPFCIIDFAGKIERTTMRQNTYSPSWDCEYFVFDVDQTCLDSKDLHTLKIKVMDWDRLGKNEVVGEVEINPEKIESILNSEEGFSEIFDLDVKPRGKQMPETKSTDCCCRIWSSEVGDECLPTTSPSFQLQIQIHHLACSLCGSEIAKLKEFATKYDTDQVTFVESYWLNHISLYLLIK